MTLAVDRAALAAHKALIAAAGRSVTYRRSTIETEITAALGKFRGDATLADDLTTTSRVFDWLFKTSDIEQQFERPMAGDQIELTNGESVTVFEVTSPGGAEPSWSYRDGGMQLIVAHTKIVKGSLQ